MNDPKLRGVIGAGLLVVPIDHVLELRHPAALHESGVTWTEPPQQRHGLGGAAHLRRPVEVGLVADHLDTELLGQTGGSEVLALGLGSELGHQTEQRQLPAGRQGGQ